MALRSLECFAGVVAKTPAGRTAYAGLPEDEQVEVLLQVAVTAAEEFGVSVRDLTLVLHGYNTTFALDGEDGRRLALRVNTNSHSTSANIAAQQAWCRAITAETDVRVPDPVITPDGRLVVEVDSAAVGRTVDVVANSWLDGPDVVRCSAEQAGALGAAMATLHQHAAGWTVTAGAGFPFPVFDEPLFGDQDLLTAHPGLVGDRGELVAEARERCRVAFVSAGSRARAIPLHADLHGGNLKWHEGRLAVFDFDDSGLGVPALDLAVATFYLRDGTEESTEIEGALREGYAAVAPLPDVDEGAFEGLVAARQLLLANSLLASSTAELRAEALPYLDVTVERLARFLRSGRFTLSETAPQTAPQTVQRPPG